MRIKFENFMLSESEIIEAAVKNAEERLRAKQVKEPDFEDVPEGGFESSAEVKEEAGKPKDKAGERSAEAERKLPEGIVGVFKKYAQILKEKLETDLFKDNTGFMGDEAEKEAVLKMFLRKSLMEKLTEKIEFLENTFGFTNEDGKIFIEKVLNETLKEK